MGFLYGISRELHELSVCRSNEFIMSCAFCGSFFVPLFAQAKEENMTIAMKNFIIAEVRQKIESRKSCNFQCLVASCVFLYTVILIRINNKLDLMSFHIFLRSGAAI